MYILIFIREREEKQMNYCSNCGNVLQGEKYCPNCGIEVGNNIVPEQKAESLPNGGNTLREQAIAQIENMMSYFGSKQELYEAFDVARDTVESLQQKTSTGWLVAGIIWELVILIFSWILRNNISNVLGVVLVFSIPTVPLILIYNKAKKRNAIKLAEKIKERDEIGTALALNYEAYGSCPVGLEYTYPSVLYAIHEIIRSGRKETIPDALQALMDDEHARRLEEEMRKTRELAEEAAIQARQANQHAQKAERNAKNAEIWSRF